MYLTAHRFTVNMLTAHSQYTHAVHVSVIGIFSVRVRRDMPDWEKLSN